VCTANISRSPYAAGRAAQLASRYAVVATSAGVPGVPGREMDPAMAAPLTARGGSAEGHVSRSLTGGLVAEADVVLTFEFMQHMRILDAWPDQAAKVFGLHQFAEALERVTPDASDATMVQRAFAAGVLDSMTWDVPDPYRRGTAAARRCADAIDAALVRILAALDGGS
jgi:protein-tyrosine-phosphatase